MSKNTDIMRELEDIGALGDKVPEVVVRRPAPSPVFSVVRNQPAAVAAVGTDKLVTGFAEQLRIMEGALQGMLTWCAAARERAQELEAASTVETMATDAVEAVEEPLESQQEEVEAPMPTPPPSKPKYSKEELKRLFLDPTFQPQAPTNVETPVTAATTTENS